MLKLYLETGDQMQYRLRMVLVTLSDKWEVIGTAVKLLSRGIISKTISAIWVQLNGSKGMSAAVVLLTLLSI